jgi:THO complex subunit 2
MVRGLVRFLRFLNTFFLFVMTEDGVNVSQWLQSLETFIGEFYKWRPFVEMQGILSYLMRQLKNGHVMELGVLRTLLKVAGGFDFADYSPTESLSENQLSGRAGSLTLQRETMSFGIKEETNPRATKTIRTLLQTDGRGVALLVLIAQARDRILFDAKRGSSKNIKLAGNLYDSCQVVMAILLNFLVSDDVDTEIVLETKQRAASLYSESLPSLQALHASFGLDFETAWFLCRPAARIGSSGDNIEKSTNSTKYDLTSDVCEAFSDCLSDVLFEYLTPKLLEFFQMNASYDIFFPEKVYSAEIERVDKDLDRIRVMNSAPSKQDSETLEPQQALSERLQKDKMSQSEHVLSVLKELDEEKSCFFVSEDVSHESARLFLSHCVFPRSLQSPDDAMYSAAFAFRLHKIWTPGFSVIHFLDEMIALVAGTLFGLTEGEAANLAVLIWQTWKIASKWRYDEGVFDREVLGKPGSQMVEILNDGEKTSKSVSHLDFIKLYRKWHSALGTTLIGCLLSPEYMHIRAGLLVLTRLVDIFPTRPPMGEKILEALSPLQDENTSRPDIRASANAYGMMLLKARDDGKWFEENEADAKARAEKEAEAAIERKKQLQQNFQELERDSSNIAAEVGPRDRSDRRDVTTPKASEVEEGRQLARGTGQSNTRSGELSRMESGEQREYRSAREDDRRDREHRSDDRGRGLVDSNGEWRRDSGNLRDDRRWPRDEPSSRNAKRSRPSSPESDREAERGNLKRQRIDVDEYPPRRNNSGGRNDPSPPSRRSRRESPEPPSRSRPRRSRR